VCAVAAATRRAILARLVSGECSVTELAQPFDMSMPPFPSTCACSSARDSSLEGATRSGGCVESKRAH
jgi:DNA-binding transcriptional ArsR family regulator